MPQIRTAGVRAHTHTHTHTHTIPSRSVPKYIVSLHCLYRTTQADEPHAEPLGHWHVCPLYLHTHRHTHTRGGSHLDRTVEKNDSSLFTRNDTEMAGDANRGVGRRGRDGRRGTLTITLKPEKNGVQEGRNN